MNHLRNWLAPKTKKLPTYRADLNLASRSLPEADKWTLSEFVLEKLIPIVGIHPYPLDELLLMCSTLAYFKPDLVLEWGTHHGKSARIFYEAAAYLGLKTNIHSIDLPPNQEHVENIHETSQRGAFVRGLPVTLHLGDGLTIAREVIQTEKFGLPLFFVDGDHSFASVQNELKSIREMAPCAVVLAHDTFLQSAGSGYNCGPYEAIREFTTQHQLPFQSTILGLPGMSLTYWI
jgi:cephalosporin hydroxylase